MKNQLAAEFSVAEAATKYDAYKTKLGQSVIASNREARLIASEFVGSEVVWDWDLPRTKEGYYHFNGGIEVSLPVEFDSGRGADPFRSTRRRRNECSLTLHKLTFCGSRRRHPISLKRKSSPRRFERSVPESSSQPLPPVQNRTHD